MPWPVQATPEPAIGNGFALTVMVLVADTPPQGLDREYVITAVPAATPLTTPVPAPTVATDGLLLIQVPPPAVFVTVIAWPTQTAPGPAIEPGEEHKTVIVTSPFPVCPTELTWLAPTL
jgi:hypothetical protein